MSTPQNPDPQPSKFLRRSETESICLLCFLTIKADRFLPIDVSEDIHSDVCLVRPAFEVSHESW